MKKNILVPVILILVIVFVFFKSFILFGKLPIPSDTIIGLYHPFRDLYAKNYPNGIPFKNFLITDPVRQQYPWRELVVSVQKQFSLPIWNPYSFSGTPLLANFQSASFYPLNVILFLLPMALGWSLLIFIQPVLAGLFLYFYLTNLKIDKRAAFLSGLSFMLCGFSIAWLEWGTILQTALWLPLILLTIDKLLVNSKDNRIWTLTLILSLVFALFAGHLQTFFYLFGFTIIYFLARWFQWGKGIKKLIIFITSIMIFILITLVQWLPTLQLILLSARNADVASWRIEGWFIPWQNLTQFLIPDFFGNPTTLNYWGIWNYGEFIGYVGMLSLIMAVFALFFRRDKKTLFFGTVLFVSLIFSLPTPFAKIPFILNIPFLSTSQPTRLLFLIDLSLCVLAGFGFDYFLKKKKGINYILAGFGLIFLAFWLFILIGNKFITPQNLLVSRQNLVLPIVLFLINAVLIILWYSIKRFNHRYVYFLKFIPLILIMILTFDLLRFSLKFTPFTNREYLFPNTEAISFIKKENEEYFRIMPIDSRILPPNFSTIYRLQSVDGYDPLYLNRYGEMLAAVGRDKPDINPPYGFYRIITPQNYQSKIIDLLGVKYLLSLSEVNAPTLTKVFQEGETRIYENKMAFDRAFFVEKVKVAKTKQEAINFLFNENYPLKLNAVVEDVFDSGLFQSSFKVGRARILNYSENKVVISTKNTGKGFLILTDSYYPTWHAKIDGKETIIYRTDYNFRGIIVPEGEHKIEYYVTLF